MVYGREFMPRYNPNNRISDCWASAGNVTFFHRDGVCYYKSRACPGFPETDAQRANAELHKRALDAWKNLSPDVQEAWNERARGVQSHRPPFDGSAHITGHNLFVSAYHGFAQLGNEHIPVPMAWEAFPVMWMEFKGVEAVGQNDLRFRFRVLLDGAADPTRYRLHLRMQLTEPGRGCRPGLLRVLLAEGNCTSADCIVTVLVQGYRELWGLDLQEYGAHCRFLLLDSQTGYRNVFRRISFTMSIL